LILSGIKNIKEVIMKRKARRGRREGKSCLVDPITDAADIERIKRLLRDNPRDLALFVCGINNGLRIGDLLSLKVGDVRRLKAGEAIQLTEKKTGKRNVFMVNHAVHKALKRYLSEIGFRDGDKLFPIGKVRAHQLVKEWTKDAGLKGNYSTHSLRKTWGYHMRTKYGAGFEVIAKRFNHSSPAVTMRYLGIQDKEVNDLLMNEI
jgi:integrase